MQICVSAALLAAGLNSQGAGGYTRQQLIEARFDPSAPFWTIETAHFRIHYTAGLAVEAQRVASLAEPIHEALSARLGWIPLGKTDIVLVAQSERTNAFTTAFPVNQIQINVAQPTFAQAIHHYGDWLRWLLAHEYTHVIHQDRVAGASRFLRPLFGSFAKPNVLHPAWLKEGLAVEFESELDSSGRADSSLYRMMLRTAERAGELGTHRFGSPRTATHYEGPEWPWINQTYLWGHTLARTAREIRGDALPGLLRVGSVKLPGLLGPALAGAGLPPIDILQGEATRRTGLRAKRELAILAGAPETPVSRLTTDGYNKFGLTIAPDGSELLFLAERPESDNEAVVVRLDEHGGAVRREKLFSRQNGHQFSYSASGRFIAFDDIDVFESHYLWSDLFVFDRAHGATIARSHGYRAREPDIHPDGVTLAFIQSQGLRDRLMLSDSGFADLAIVYEAPRLRRLSEPRWSPDGTSLVFIEHEESTGGDRLMLWRGGGIVALTDGASIDRDPEWSPDGEWILFSSDRAGLFQLYAFSTRNRDVLQVTHRYGGAFWPVPDPNGRFLYFLDYSARGYDVARIDWKPSSWRPAGDLPTLRRVDSSADAIGADDSAGLAPKRYSSWRYLGPKYLLPSIVLRKDGLQVGLATGSVDPAFFRYYELSARWDIRRERLLGRLLYYDGARSLPWSIEVDKDVVPVGAGDEELASTTISLDLHVPLGKRGQKSLEIGTVVQEYAPSSGAQLLGGVSARFELDSRLRQPGQLVAERGRHVALGARQLARRRDTPVTILDGHYEVAIPLRRLGAHTTATARAQAAWVAARGGSEYLVYAGGRQSFPFDLASEYEFSAYPPNALAADRLALVTARLTRPIWRVERGLQTVPGYLEHLGVAVRGEYGVFGRSGMTGTGWSLGLEVLASIEFTPHFPTSWSLGVFHGRADPGADTRVVLQVQVGR